MSKLKCKITLQTWYQEIPKENQKEILPNNFESIDASLEWLSNNYKELLDNYPIVGLKIAYE